MTGRHVVLRVLVLMLVCLALQASSARAREREEAVAVRADLLARFLDLLDLRFDAKLGAADILHETGRFEEALEVYRGINALAARELERFERLLEGIVLSSGPEDLVRFPGNWRGLRVRPSAAPQGALPRWEPIDRIPGALHRAVTDALKWLAAHQSPTGAWEAAGFTRWCNGRPADGGPSGKGKPIYDVGVTGLALLAFLGAGHTHREDGRYAELVGRGLRFLVGVQDAEGCIGPRDSQHFVYNHGIATRALVEAFVRTKDAGLREPVQKALDFIALARNPYYAWRYGVKPGDNDTSVTAWMVTALGRAKDANEAAAKAGEPAPFVLDEGAFAGARAWVEKMTDPASGRVGYIQRGTGSARPSEMLDRFPADKGEAMTAAGIVIRVLAGEDAGTSEIVHKGALRIAAKPPRWNPRDGSIDHCYWYYGALALFHYGGSEWLNWKTALAEALLEHQRLDDPGFCGMRGSWDPVGPWGPDGGRVYSTALMAMALQIAIRADFPE